MNIILCNLALVCDLALARDRDFDIDVTRARNYFIATCKLRSRKFFRRSHVDVEPIEKASFSVYVSFINLDGRIKGELNAFEGVRLVKERITRSAE